MIGRIVTLESLFRYESAHMLPKVPAGHKCGVMHGHSYELTVVVRGPIREDGFVIDFTDIKDAVNPLVKQLDHQTLNDIEGLSNPTVEAQLVWLWDHLSSLTYLWELRLRETANNSASYLGPYG